jgi:hypothetical protein
MWMSLTVTWIRHPTENTKQNKLIARLLPIQFDA